MQCLPIPKVRDQSGTSSSPFGLISHSNPKSIYTKGRQNYCIANDPITVIKMNQ